MKLIEYLYNQENKYIEEIDRLEKNHEDVSFLDVGNDSGWICLKSTDGSFDWNIVRLLGKLDIAYSSLYCLPFKEAIILIDDNYNLDNVMNCCKAGSLIYFENVVDNSLLSLNNDFEISLPKNILLKKASPLNSRVDDLYLFMKNKICGFCKVIKNTWHYSEIVIEINPEFRNQGFGSSLLGMMVEQFNQLGLKLSYVVEDDNIPSIKIAEKFLTESFRLKKYIYKNDNYYLSG